MVEQRARRPPAGSVGPVLGRVCTVDGGRRAGDRDEESLREEHAQLRVSVADKRREAAEIRERLKVAEKESFAKDKVLQELLAGAKCGSNVPAEALDRLREDLQVSLHCKRKAQESRLQLEERQQKIEAIQQELSASRIDEMKMDVEAAKSHAKAMANEWAEANSGDRDTRCFTASQQHQRAAKEYVTKIASVENEVSASYQRIATLSEERTRLEKARDDHMRQIEKLQEKRAEIEQQKEQCANRASNLGNLHERHELLQRDVRGTLAEVTQVRQEEVRNQMERASSRLSDIPWEVSGTVLAPKFVPVSSDDEVARLLWRLRHAVEAGKGRSLLKLLEAEDADSDRRVTVQELASLLRRLRIPGSEAMPSSKLSAALSNALKPSGDGLVPVVDFVLSLPLQRPPSAPSEAAVQSSIEAFMWAARRERLSEQEFRSRVAQWIEDPPFAGFEEAAKQLCKELGLEPSCGSMIGRALDAHRVRFASRIPSWRCTSPKGTRARGEHGGRRAKLLARFLRDIAAYRDTIGAGLADRPVMSLSEFLQVAGQLGERWSQHDLEEVALLAEVDGCAASAPPSVNGARLVRAAMVGGFKAEFPAVAAACAPEGLKSCEAAAAAPPKRSAPAAALPTAEKPAAAAGIWDALGPVGARANALAAGGAGGAGEAVSAPEPSAPARPSSETSAPSGGAAPADAALQKPASPAAFAPSAGGPDTVAIGGGVQNPASPAERGTSPLIEKDSSLAFSGLTDTGVLGSGIGSGIGIGGKPASPGGGPGATGSSLRRTPSPKGRTPSPKGTPQGGDGSSLGISATGAGVSGTGVLASPGRASDTEEYGDEDFEEMDESLDASGESP
eukprot:gnl/TRDRNA2_/TRDRNA2_84319_c0_seq2.p1 gnl/TRDRNA2_/TRDRNA2_84319_c0~~gnl/TRDRNA2_/TRDRNA2_84319_c0_seq2.p1  ORF type:complete len:871 (-),score=198.98 gnl/TRDRNA2_/TRDRNA2_84319_c0_seq2:148-2691(-)